MPDATSYLALANRLADAARGETLARWNAGIAADNKAAAGWDPVTEADREAERVMREIIAAAESDHGIDGEEFPSRPAQGPWSWSLDPVDGTRAFVCQLPTWVTLIGLLYDGVPVLGVIDAPCLDERYVAVDKSAHLVRKGAQHPLSTSGCRTVEEARLSTTDPYLFTGSGVDGFRTLRERVRTARYGFDGYAYARLAAGSLDLVVEPALKTYDYHALIPVVRAAGGVFGDWKGGEDFSSGNVIAAASRRLYDAAVEMMRGAA